MATKHELCAVCGSALPALMGNDQPCMACGFAYPGVRQFAGRSSLRVWRQSVADKKKELLRRMIRFCSETPRFRLSGGNLSLLLPAGGPALPDLPESTKGGLLLVSAAGKNFHADICQYAAADNAVRCQIFLTRDGHVRAMGDNTCGQCNTQDLADIRFVAATAECTYAVTGDGRVYWRGQPACRDTAQLDAWREIRQIAAGSYHLAALTKDGRVLIAGDMLDSKVTQEIAGWRDVCMVACAGNATIALCRDGSVRFAGRPGDPRTAARDWKDMAAVAIESIYAVGLTKDGRVLLAGSNPNPDLDMGRGEAAGWDNVVAITCTRSGIAALGADGTVRLAGNIRGLRSLSAAWNASAEAIYRQLLHGAQQVPVW